VVRSSFAGGNKLVSLVWSLRVLIETQSCPKRTYDSTEAIALECSRTVSFYGHVRPARKLL